MAFIDRVVGPDEKLIGIVSVHWIYGAKGIAWMAGLMLFGLFLDFQVEKLIAGEPRYGGVVGLEVIGNYAFWTATFMGVLLLLLYVVMMLTTELGLTTKRIIYKRGLLFVDVKESDLEEIKAADIDNGFFGRILNYGYINFDARFVANVSLPAINDPYRFLKAMNEMRSDLKEGSSMNAVLEGHRGAMRVQNDEESGNVEIKPSKKSKTLHNINEERYAGLDSNVIKAAQGMIEDTVEEIDNSKQKIKKDVKQAQDIKTPLQTSKPILFKRDIRRRKDELRRRMKSVFTQTSKQSDKL